MVYGFGDFHENILAPCNVPAVLKSSYRYNNKMLEGYLSRHRDCHLTDVTFPNNDELNPNSSCLPFVRVIEAYHVFSFVILRTVL